MKMLIALLLIALALFVLWRWAVAIGAAGLLDWIDERFPRETAMEQAASGTYGSHPSQKVELWQPAVPAGGESKVLVVFLHGGGWHSGAPDAYRFVARALGEMGHATALVGYRLVPEGRFPAMLEDSAAGLRCIAENACRHGIDAGRIVLMGHSAGAYNALMLGLDPQWLDGAGLPPSTVVGVISLAGPADFYPFDTDSSRNAFGHAEDPRATQPVTVARNGSPPVLLLHGDADTTVRPRNSRALHAVLQGAGARSELIEFPGMSHAGIIMAFARPFDRNRDVLDRVEHFLRETASAPDLGPASAAVQGNAR